MTDSELVPWGQEKHLDRGNEIVSETECLQAVRASLRSDGYLCIMGQRLSLCSKLKPLGVGEGNQS